MNKNEFIFKLKRRILNLEIKGYKTILYWEMHCFVMLSLLYDYNTNNFKYSKILYYNMPLNIIFIEWGLKSLESIDVIIFKIEVFLTKILRAFIFKMLGIFPI